MLQHKIIRNRTGRHTLDRRFDWVPGLTYRTNDIYMGNPTGVHDFDD